ncbi:alpha/beta hydrolase [Ferrimonas pelagia]|uniref:Permease n=1 Tax=Ferrimonas pelagia TaxID=1177826 RepID=A0ABP9ECA8_9GAMM
MKPESDNHNRASNDLQGSTRLTVEAIVAVTHIVESMHQTIATLALDRQPVERKRTRGISRYVYRGIRSYSHWLGKTLDKPLAKLGQRIDAQPRTAKRERLVAILNGVLGDHLEARDNPLAISMQWRQDGVALSTESLAQTLKAHNGRMLLMIHGLCMNDHLWQQGEHNHGLALAEALGLCPVYLYYNTGRPISDNGQQLAQQLAQLSEQLEVPLQLAMVGHSMGGLLARSAVYYGQQRGDHWPAQLQKMVSLGTPHHGALLEKGGNLIDVVLPASPYSAPFTRLAQLRSRGITDLRYGHITEHDWGGRDRFVLGQDQRQVVPLPSGVDCYAIAAVRSEQRGIRSEQLVGDGLVSLNSALGRHRLPHYALAYPPSHCWVGRSMGHNDLLGDPTVFERLKDWLA